MSAAQRKKVMIIQSVIPHYRTPVFNELAKKFDLTVVHDKGEAPKDAEFQTNKIGIKRIKGIPKFHTKNLLSMAKDYDVVISMLDSSYLTTRLLCRFRGKTKLILWGIGVAAGYKTRYDSSSEVADTCCRMIQKADAALFYAQYPVEKYTKMGVPAQKLFVANNTVRVLTPEKAEKEHILFVGTLYKAKKIFELLMCYQEACKGSSNMPKLVIVGDGEDASAVKQWVSNNDMEDQVVLKGAIYDEKELATLFSKAIACVSPDQAGLTVLQSFGYGVPFITHKNAITGGERHNIVSGETGILLESFDEMTDVLRECADNRQAFLTMGENAQRFYRENRTVAHMTKGFCDAIAYVTNA